MLERVVGRMFWTAATRYCYTNPMYKTSTAGTSSTAKSSAGTEDEGDIEIDNSSHVLVKVATLYAEQLMTDICLVVGGVEYPAHRLILCASSEVFQVMLMNPRWNESHESKVVLRETPSCAQNFGQFLRYFYTGQIRINHSTIMPVLILADKYNVKDLVNLCINYMCDHIAHAAINNQLVTWFQYTLSLGHYKVAKACENFVKWNLTLVAGMSDFGNFQHNILSRLLRQNDIVVRDEYTVYLCVVRWLEVQHKTLIARAQNEEVNVEDEMENLVHMVMEFVRFPMMTPRQLAELLLSPLIQKYKEFFIEKMAIGMSYHNDQSERVQEVFKSGTGRLMFTPRLYTSDKWCSQLMLENFPNLMPYHTRTLVFNSHSVYAEHGANKTCDWIVDVYPKGVWFRKFFLIVWQGTVEVPESVLRTVRVTVTCKDPPEGADLRVKVGLLVTGMQDGVEHIMSVITRNHRFSEDDKVFNIDDILNFDDLNNTIGLVNGEPRMSPYLVGEGRDILKIHIVIAPLTDACCMENDVSPIETMVKDCHVPMIH